MGYGGYGGGYGGGGTYGPGTSQAILACPITQTQPTAVGVGYQPGIVAPGQQPGIVAPGQLPAAQPPLVCAAPATGGSYTCAPGTAPSNLAPGALGARPATPAPAAAAPAPAPAVTPSVRPALPAAPAVAPNPAPQVALKPASQSHKFKKLLLILFLLGLVGAGVGFLLVRSRARQG
jgi:hypothetical protein